MGNAYLITPELQNSGEAPRRILTVVHHEKPQEWVRRLYADVASLFATGVDWGRDVAGRRTMNSLPLPGPRLSTLTFPS